MNWFILAIAAIFFSSIANLVQRVAMKEEQSDPLISAILFQLILALLTGIFALIRGFIPPPFFEFFWQFMISAFCYALGTLCMFQAAKRIEASEKIILSASGAIVTIVVAIIFLHESFSVKQLIGTGLVLLAVILVQNKLRLTKNIGTLYAILGTSLYAIAVVSDTAILRHYDAVSYTPIASFLPGLVLLLFNFRVISKFKRLHLSSKYLLNLFLFGLFWGIQAILYYSAINLGANASQMAPLFRSEIILTVLLATIFLKERKNLTIKLFSAVIVSIGLLLIK